MTSIDYTHISCLFLVSNDRKILQVKEVHSKKLKNLGLYSISNKHDPDKIISNYSSHVLTTTEKNLLAKGLNYALPPKKLNYADYLVPHELLYKNIIDSIKGDNILERVKVNF